MPLPAAFLFQHEEDWRPRNYDCKLQTTLLPSRTRTSTIGTANR